MLPMINVMHSGHDFMWEREWRIAENLEFELDDVKCVIFVEIARTPGAHR